MQHNNENIECAIIREARRGSNRTNCTCKYIIKELKGEKINTDN